MVNNKIYVYEAGLRLSFLVLLVFSSVNAKADTPVKINIDDVNRVTVKVNYVPVADLANGTNNG